MFCVDISKCMYAPHTHTLFYARPYSVYKCGSLSRFLPLNVLHHTVDFKFRILTHSSTLIKSHTWNFIMINVLQRIWDDTIQRTRFMPHKVNCCLCHVRNDLLLRFSLAQHSSILHECTSKSPFHVPYILQLCHSLTSLWMIQDGRSSSFTVLNWQEWKTIRLRLRKNWTELRNFKGLGNMWLVNLCQNIQSNEHERVSLYSWYSTVK